MKRYILVTIAVLMVTGCDFLDTKTDIDITGEMIDSDYGKIAQIGQGIYSYIKCGLWELDGNIGAARSDEAVETMSGMSVQLYNNGSWNDLTNPENYLYEEFYKGIHNAHYFLDYSENYPNMLKKDRDIISDGGADYKRDVDNIRWTRAEAHVALAWYYFELTKRYGGVPLVKEVIHTREFFPTAEYGEVIDYIVERIDFALDSLRISWRETIDGVEGDRTRDGRFTVGAALALKSRALLYAASPLHNPSGEVSKWQKAAEAARAVIDLGLYSLDNDYSNLFLSNNGLDSPEAILMYRDGNSNDPEKKNYPVGTPGGNSGVTPSGNLADAYEYAGLPDPQDPYANRDPRFYASIVYNGDYWNGRIIDISAGGQDSYLNDRASRTGYYLKKFLMPDLYLLQGDSDRHVWPLFRYGEILLNYTEAMNEAYGPDIVPAGYLMSAREALNLIRSRPSVGMPNVTVSDRDGFRDAVKHERRIELAFEGHRYWDLVRWTDGEVLSKEITGVVATATDYGYQYSKVTVEQRVFETPKMYLYPFPYDEIKRSGGVLEQNPGW